MAGRLIIPGICPALDANGKVDPGASFQFYENRTTTPPDIFEGPDLQVALDNPLVPDSSGRIPEIWGPDGSVYTVEWTPTGESPITYDDIALSATPTPADQYLPVARFISNKPTNAQTVLIWNVPFPLRLAADLDDGLYPSIVTIATNPTATMEFTLFKNNTPIGGISYSTSGVPTIDVVADVDFIATDQFIITGPDTADATGNNIAWTFMFKLI